MSIKTTDILSKVEELYEKGITSGKSTGWSELDKIITLKLGTTFYLYGQPASGKTELWLELLVNTSELYGWKHVIFSPESGDAEHVIAELISKKFRKPFHSNIHGSISEQEFYQGVAWSEEYFRIIESEDKHITVENYLTEISDTVRSGFKPQTTMIDPWNELHHDLSQSGGREDLYLQDKLGLIRKDAISHGRINCIITHIADQKVIDREGKRWYPAPTPREIAGGQAWHRKGMNMIGVWRPPANMIGENGMPYKDNECHVQVHKYKPKGTGKRGTAIMYYDFKTNSYIQQDEYQTLSNSNRDANRTAKPRTNQPQQAINYTQREITTEEQPPF